MYRRTGIVSMTAVSLFLFCGQSAPVACKDPGPSKGEVIGVGVAVGAVVAGTIIAVEVHAHHTLKGCVVSGPNGTELRTGNGTKSYLLAGDTSLKVGDMVKIHGTKVKQPKGSTGDQTFTVEQLKKDYGPCKVTP
jgi:hypothetical protein